MGFIRIGTTLVNTRHIRTLDILQAPEAGYKLIKVTYNRDSGSFGNILTQSCSDTWKLKTPHDMGYYTMYFKTELENAEKPDTAK